MKIDFYLQGVTIPGFGTFTFTQQKLDVGNSKYILIQRPVFSLSEKFAQTHGLNTTKHHVAGKYEMIFNYIKCEFNLLEYVHKILNICI